MMTAIFRILFGSIPSGMVFLCAILTFLVPYVIYRVNTTIHHYGDPAWKKRQ
jgi:hypothetical protein